MRRLQTVDAIVSMISTSLITYRHADNDVANSWLCLRICRRKHTTTKTLTTLRVTLHCTLLIVFFPISVYMYLSVFVCVYPYTRTYSKPKTKDVPLLGNARINKWPRTKCRLWTRTKSRTLILHFTRSLCLFLW